MSRVIRPKLATRLGVTVAVMLLAAVSFARSGGAAREQPRRANTEP